MTAMTKRRGSQGRRTVDGSAGPNGQAAAVDRAGTRKSLAIGLACLALTLSVRSPAAADPQPFVVKDINAAMSGFNPTNLAGVNGVLYFSAYEPSTGTELWKSDGTPEGTVLVRDINPGRGSSSPQYLVNLNGVLLFRVDGGTGGAELWRSDGTPAGTVLVKDINPGGSSFPAALTLHNNVLYFTATDSTSGYELWKSDGTAAGTVLVKDIRPGTPSSSLHNLKAVGSNLFFFADDGTYGPELWKSDGTEAGTLMVKDIYPGVNPSTFSNSFLDAGGVLYFVAQDLASGRELWKSDGTEAGTVLVKDLRPGPTDGWPNQLLFLDGLVYFTANDGTHGSELWRSDGTPEGTVLVADIMPGSTPSSTTYLTSLAGELFFSANDGTRGQELWKSDGTASGTALVRDIVPAGSSTPMNLTALEGALYFAAATGTNGRELWKSDGTAAGTALLKDINYGAASSSPSSLTVVDGVLYFSATGGIGGTGLWKSDGTEAGTILLRESHYRTADSSPNSLTNVNGELFFVANDGPSGTELRRSDGTSAGTVLVKEITPNTGGTYFAGLTNVSGMLYFAAYTYSTGDELYQSDGTEAGTVLVKDIYPGATGATPRNLTNVNGVVYFSANDGTWGTELWKSDGTAAGTVLVKDIRPGSASSNPGGLTEVNGKLFFQADNGTSGAELWSSDGTAAGTVMVRDIIPGSGASSPNYLTSANGGLYFRAYDGTSGSELWKSDGTEAGTTLVKDINPGTGNSSPSNLTNVGGVLFFRAYDPTNGTELWRSDGTAAATMLVKDIAPGTGSSSPWYLTGADGPLYFLANDGTSGDELWRSDGTAAGTVLVKDINAGGSSSPGWLTNVNGAVYFTANDGTSGSELWKSDGTAAGTVMVKDILPGPGGSAPGSLVSVNGVLFFAAEDEWLGRELFALDTNSVADATAPTTAAVPAPGSFDAPQSVALGCSDAGGSGCAGIYFTLDGSVPTENSQPYSGAILLHATTTLSYFAIDVAGNREAPHAGTYVFVDDATPIITIAEPGSAAAQSKTLAASAADNLDSAPTLTMSDASPSTTCDETRSFAAYLPLTFAAEADNGTRVCYRSEDRTGHTTYALSNAIAGIDTLAPSVSVDNPGSAAAQSKLLTASVTDTQDPAPGLSMTPAGTSSICDATRSFFVAYQAVTFSAEADNGTRVCYRGNDWLGRTTYALSDPIAGIDRTAPALSVVDPGTAPAQGKILTASVTDAQDPAPVLTMSDASTSTICDGTRVFGTYSAVTFSAEADNGKRICYRGVDWAGNTSYLLSPAIAGIDTTGPTVTLDQAAAQADPTTGSPIGFTVVFSEAVTGFAGADVAVGGTAGGAKAASVTGGGTTYAVEVSGMAGLGTVTASIPAGVAVDAAGNPNAASTSVDNEVAFDGRSAQSITVTTHTPAEAGYGTAFPVAATAGSGLDVAITTSGACSGGGTGSATITMTASAGTCTVAFDQEGDGSFRPAPTVTEETAARNTAPSDVALSGSSVPENQPAGTVVGTLSSTDVDPGDSFAYSIVPGAGDADNASFRIVGAQLQTSAALDFEAGATRSIRVRSADAAGGSVEEVFAISVTDGNDPPALGPPGAIFATEGELLEVAIPAVDQDGDALQFTLAAGPEGATIDGTTGVLSWRPSLSQAGSHDVAVTVADPFGGSDTAVFAVVVGPPGGPVFADDFADATAAGDADWTKISGAWAGGNGLWTARSTTLRNLSRVTAIDPVDLPLGAGVVAAKVKLTSRASAGPNALILFGYLDPAHYRWVKLTPTKILVGQAGVLDGIAAGRKKAARKALRVGRWTTVTVRIEADGWVRVYRDAELAPALEYQFLGPLGPSVVPGGVGLGAIKAKAIFDDVALWEDSALAP